MRMLLANGLKTQLILYGYPKAGMLSNGRNLAVSLFGSVVDLLLHALHQRKASPRRWDVRFVVCRINLLLVFMVCFPMVFAFAEPASAIGGSSIFPAVNMPNRLPSIFNNGANRGKLPPKFDEVWRKSDGLYRLLVQKTAGINEAPTQKDPTSNYPSVSGRSVVEKS